MRKTVVLGMSAAALLASAVFAQDADNTRMAAANTAAAMFTKLDADADGRVSAIEAANDTKVAQGFTAADADKDGYLSKAEFAQLSKSMDRSSPASSAEPRSQSTTPETSQPTPEQ
jgi:Ca2+-binding EF-hand superfamily protein